MRKAHGSNPFRSIPLGFFAVQLAFYSLPLPASLSFYFLFFSQMATPPKTPGARHVSCGPNLSRMGPHTNRPTSSPLSSLTGDWRAHLSVRLWAVPAVTCCSRRATARGVAWPGPPHARISASFISAAPLAAAQLAPEKTPPPPDTRHAMADGDHAAVGHDDVLESDKEDFTFAAAAAAAVPCMAGGGRIGAVYPVFGRPRSPPPVQGEDPDTATVRVPLRQLLLEERTSSGQQADDDGDLDGVPAETYCLWSPGSPAAAVSPARCQKSGSTGSVLRWRQRLIGRSHSDGKEKFVFLSSSSDRSKGRTTSGDVGGHGGGWRYYGRGGGSGGAGAGGNGGGRRPSFLPYKQDLVGLFANVGAFRRSYHPF